ncbi:serine protease inhibitor [Cyanobium gracile UHCC 0139]|uniref:Serine protease inhibitor n=1 Tax=Cyanobium gracile UHCC 0139 TaxID=3110308 RepID=A0ABU5RR26_9CYAN|nr:serine protease inhibitor [Cyanobium gracile]MEA5390205.1 serine protease inhibitor [Cyanobium gracile UHCC 0139]
MTTSSFGASLPVGLAPSRPLCRPLGQSFAGRGHRAPARHHLAAAPLLLAVGLVLGAVVLAPEQPLDQEAICQRHNGVAACRVW